MRGGLRSAFRARSLASVRLEHFSRMIGLAVGGAVALLMLVGLLRDMGWRELFSPD